MIARGCCSHGFRIVALGPAMNATTDSIHCYTQPKEAQSIMLEALLKRLYLVVVTDTIIAMLRIEVLLHDKAHSLRCR